MKEEITWHLIDEEGLPEKDRAWDDFLFKTKIGCIELDRAIIAYRNCAYPYSNYDRIVAWAEMPKGPEVGK